MRVVAECTRQKSVRKNNKNCQKGIFFFEAILFYAEGGNEVSGEEQGIFCFFCVNKSKQHKLKTTKKNTL